MPAVSEKQRRAMYAAAEGRSTLGIPKSVGEEFVGARKDAAARGDCAGILFRVRTGPLYLLLKRADTGEWCIPGGHLEGDERPAEAAERECMEEIGTCPDGLRWAVRRNSIPSGKGVFTCYMQDVPEPFEPELNEEHTNWGWFEPGALPQPMHRKVAETIERVSGTELDVAKRIAAGELLSPQRYENMWLFDLRITGTGTSYRKALDEYVYRPPEQFLTKEFLERCNGLSVIFIHPEDTLLSTEEFRQRSIGSVLLPYIKGDEVWGVAKVFDDDAAVAMRTTHVSTSPAVLFRDAGSTETVKLDDGSTVLIEGKPSYLDHLAIVDAGVWDKGGEPTGVNLNGETAVEENEEKVPAWADALNRKMDAMCARVDALENKGEVADRKDSESEKEREEAAKKGAEEHKEREEHKEERKDSEAEAKKEGEAEKKEEHKAAEAIKEAEKDGEKERKAEERADAQARENADLRRQIEEMNQRLTGLTRPLSAAERDELSRVQGRADRLAHMFGDSVSPPLHGESPIAYRKRLAAKFQKHSEVMKDEKLDGLSERAFAVVEDRIYADAQAAARSPAKQPQGRLLPHTDHSTGRPITTYTGDPNAWMQHFKAPGYIGRINRDAKGVH
jgi:8-oxo-dGTP pyrophosphatase MutT (NUDIX family)